MNDNNLKDLCGKLQGLLQHELEVGNRIIAMDTGWSNVRLAIRMDNPLDMEYIRKAAGHDKDLQIWESRDIKNPREAGVLCRSAKQTLSGAIRDKSMRKNSP